MSRELYRAKSKRVQKLGRDGLVEQDKATGEERRVSQRTADVFLGPDRTPDQGPQRTPAMGKKRRQPPPPPEGHPINEAEPSPAMREADDVPVLVPPPDTDDGQSRKRRQRKQAQRFREDAAPPVQADTQDGGRLHFEDEGTPAAQDHATEQERPHLRFEDEKARASDVGGGPDTPPPSRRQQKQYERAERKVEQSGRRLKRAQAKLPVKRRARLEQEYDADLGKVRRRLRFEEEVQPEQASPSLPAQAGHTLKMAAVMKLHGKFREVEHQNVAVEAAHKGEFAAERATGRFLRWNKRRLRSKPYRAARRAEHRLAQN